MNKSKWKKILLLAGAVCVVVPLIINSLAGSIWKICERNDLWRGSNFQCEPIIMELLSYVVYIGILFLFAGSLIFIWKRSNIGKILKIVFSLLTAALLILAGMLSVSSLHVGVSVYGVAKNIFESRAYMAERKYREPISCRGQDCKKPEKIPESVAEAYQKYLREPIHSMIYCVNGKKEIYNIGGGGGYTGTNEYFDGTGKRLAVESFSDAIAVGITPLPYDLHGYTCTVLSR
ncbi:MAG: hypothetical protein WCT49_02020 [Candidatus Paceibacterota bacterium]|jgi:hypothetical protein|nr:hypothetical protein [Candidatus Paceibacterota bacterium]